MIPSIPKLEDYGLSANYGFLPEHPPLTRLENPYYAPWETLLKNLGTLIRAQKVRESVNALPVLTPDKLVSEAERRRAYMMLGFMTHAYVWGGVNACERLPPAVSIPFLRLSETLGIPPVATYAAVCLWNYRLRDLNKPADDPENLESLLTFTGTEDEAWFYLISVAIEARGAPTIPLMLEAMRAARDDDTQTVKDCLNIFSSRIEDLTLLLKRMYEKCRPHVFYFGIRPFLAGSKRMAEAGLPNGVFYDTGSDDDCYREYSGGSNAQSSLIQAFDIILGVEHYPTGQKKDPAISSLEGTAPPPKHNFIQEMRKYMPGPHRQFLEHLCLIPNIHSYTESRLDDIEMCTAYNKCLGALEQLRAAHKAIVARYIIVPASQAKQATLDPEASKTAPIRNIAGSMALESESPPAGGGHGLASNEAAKNGLKGTGGTQLMPFLEQSRVETLAVAVGDRMPTKTESIKRHPPNCNGFVRTCKVNEFEDYTPPAAGMAGSWEDGSEIGGLCSY
uniref:Indoleamine 2,3-dioxygenase n=1 Tax=Tuber melanosporum TaxID=39416 RepID=G1UJZ8_TUBME|nr:indoleamine 2,3-dioxygenase alpha/beta type [Tuber melanosporum]